MGTVDVYRLDEVRGSVLTPEPQYDYVTHDGETYRIWVDASPATVVDYRYTVHEVARDSRDRAAFVRRTRDRYQFRLEGLSAPERETVETATGRGGYVISQDSEEQAAYRSLSERFRAHEVIVGSSTDPDIARGEYLVRHEARTYWAVMEFYATPMGRPE